MVRNKIIPIPFARLPFNPATRIKYSLPADDHVKLEVFNLRGSKVATLVNAKQARGAYTVAFDGEGLSSGIYYYRLEAGDLVELKRMVLVKTAFIPR